MQIRQINAREIFDSRAQSTLEIGISDAHGREFTALVPSGKSRGRSEVRVFTYPQARRALNRIVKPALYARNFRSLKSFDRFLKSLDKSPAKSRLGGNLMLGLSQAAARALAAENGQACWQFLNAEFFQKKDLRTRPLIFSNFINGGVHAQDSLAIQEYLVIARPLGSMTRTVKILIKLYRLLGQKLKKAYKLKNIPIGDESGYSLNFPDNFAPLKVLKELLARRPDAKHFVLGLDAAASNFYKKNYYQFEGHKYPTRKFLEVYLGYFKRSRLLYAVEDPFAERDFAGFQMLRTLLKGKLVIGDDLTTTSAAAIRKFAKSGLINAVIIKPNQIGTVTETCEAIQAAKDSRIKFIVSHRSGETDDNFIIHLARASGADGVKIGAPLRERIYKFDELIWVYEH